MSKPRDFSGQPAGPLVLFGFIILVDLTVSSFAAPKVVEAGDCGVVALSRLSGGHPIQTQTKAETLATLQQLAHEEGLDLRMAYREDGSATFPSPCIIHWRLGHFSAVTASEPGRFRFDDPALDPAPVWFDRSQLDGLASGYVLLLAQSGLPPGWREVSAEEGAAVFGGHFLTPKPGSVGPGNPKAKEKDCNEMPGGEPPRSCGMADWDIALMMASLEVSDTPLGYRPPFGPEVFFNLQYNERETNQPLTLTYANFGPLWNCDWIGSLTFQGTSAFFNRGQGGIETFTGFDEGTQSYQPSYQTWHGLVRVSATRCELLHRDGSKIVFALADNPAAPTRLFMTQVIDPQGNAATISYDASYRVTKVTDALGQESLFTYGTGAESLLVKKITDPFGRFATFDYDGVGRLIRITDAIGLTSDFTYNANNQMLTMVTGYGTTAFAYGTVPGSRSVEVTHPNGEKERVEQRNDTTPGVPASDPAELVPSGSYANSLLDHWNTFYWDRKAYAEAAGDCTRARHYHFLRELGSVQTPVLESIKIPGENRVWFSYQGQTSANVGGPGMMGHSPSAVARVLDDGSTQKFRTTFNAPGNPLSETDPAGREVTYVYAANGIDLVEMRRKTGATSSVRLMAATYDARHLPLTITDPAGQTTSFAWNARGQLASRTTPLGQTINYFYDANGYLTSVDLPLPGASDSISFTYDSTGRLRTRTEADGYSLTFDYDDLDRPVKTTFPDGTFEEIVWHFLQPASIRDRLGRITAYTYDSLGQLTSVTDPLSRTILYEWCRCGGLKALIDPLGRRTSWKHDIASRLVGKVYPDSSEETYRYDTAGRLSTSTDAKGQTKEFSYDVANHLTGLSYRDALISTPGVNFAYDPWFDRAISRTDGSGTTFYSFHPVNDSPSPGASRLASIDGPLPDDTLTFVYDPLGRVVSRSVGDAVETKTFDALGRLVSVSNSLGAFSYTYDGATLRPATILMPGGWQTTFEYFNALGDYRLKSIRHLRPDSGPLSRHDYGYDAHGRPVTWSRQIDGNPAEVFSLAYDDADRLTAFSSMSETHVYSYDAAGNRLTETIDGIPATATYNPLNELTDINSTTPIPQRIYEWDAEDRLVAIQYPGTNLRSEFHYDGFDRCVRIVEKDGIAVSSDRRFVWCGNERFEVRDADGETVLHRFFPQGEQVTGQALLYFRDHLGNVREASDTASVRARYVYDPWGRRTKLSGDANVSTGFSGHFFHEPSGLTVAPFRFYDAEQGRWLNRDPLGEAKGLNLFTYLGNSPALDRDPLGFEKGGGGGRTGFFQLSAEKNNYVDPDGKLQEIQPLSDAEAIELGSLANEVVGKLPRRNEQKNGAYCKTHADNEKRRGKKAIQVPFRGPLGGFINVFQAKHYAVVEGKNLCGVPVYSQLNGNDTTNTSKLEKDNMLFVKPGYVQQVFGQSKSY
mgnify:CR=1 FL=1